MPNWKRITLVVFVLIGGTMAFSYWSFSQFNTALDDLSASSVANTLTVSSVLKKDAEAPASSSEETIPVVTSTTTTATGSASSSQAITPVAASPIDLGTSFTFPQKGDKIYTGCTYPISWQSSTTINSLEIVLVDAGAKKVIDPTASGLAKENTIEKDLQNLTWKVGTMVWPGQYYIKVSKINDPDVEIRSKVFTINNMPKGINTDERAKICKKSGSLF